MEDIRSGGKSALADMRRMLGLLLEDPSPDPEPGLENARDLLARLERVGFATTFAVANTFPHLPAEQQSAAYRILQEAVTNAFQHAATTRVDMTLQPIGNEVCLEIVNNGNAISNGGGSDHGTHTMRQRAALLGGNLVSGPLDDGWRVRLTLPLCQVDSPTRTVTSAELP